MPTDESRTAGMTYEMIDDMSQDRLLEFIKNSNHLHRGTASKQTPVKKLRKLARDILKQQAKQ